MRQKILVIALVVSVALNVGALAMFAYRRATMPKPPEPPDRLAEKLNLTQEQRDAMREQREKSLREMEPLRREMDRKRSDVLALLEEPEVDVARRDQLFADIAELQMRMELQAFEHMHQTMDTLHPEQRERFIKLLEERFRHKRERFPRGPVHGSQGREFGPKMTRERSGEGR
jgi:Spy/CpxP family protein refolding chaperone